jgi:hypothetical protein
MSCSGSHLGITINIKTTKFVKDLPMIDAQFRFNQCNSFREEYIYGKNVSKRFFSETTWTVETKLLRNDHYKVSVCYADRKSKMAASTGHSINNPNNNQRLSRACIVHLVIKKNNWFYVKTMSCSGSHLGITINIKNTQTTQE